jgi:hypothetical protein
MHAYFRTSFLYSALLLLAACPGQGPDSGGQTAGAIPQGRTPGSGPIGATSGTVGTSGTGGGPAQAGNTTGGARVRAPTGFTRVAGAETLTVLSADRAGNFYAVDGTLRLVHSFDGGATWTVAGAPFNTIVQLIALHIDAGDPNQFYLDTLSKTSLALRETLLSQDAGATRSTVPQHTLQAADRYRHDVVYGQVQAQANLPPVWERSVNKGKNWSTLVQGNANAVRADTIVFDDSDPNRLYLSGAGNGFWASPDNGSTWEQVDNAYHLLAAGSPKGVFYARDATQNVTMRSNDFGKTWVPFDTASVAQMLVVPWNPAIVYRLTTDIDARTPPTLSVTINGGSTWSGPLTTDPSKATCTTHLAVDEKRRLIYVYGPLGCGIYAAAP